MEDFDWTAFWEGTGAFIEAWKIPVTIVGVIVGAILLRGLLTILIRRIVERVVSGVKKRHNTDDTQALLASPLAAVRVVQRTRTLGSVLSNIVTALIGIIAFLILLTTLVPNISGAFALITAALGAGLGFGAQNIVKDVLNGLFMVIEDQLGVGDVVDLGPATGVVENVGIRVTQVRDVNGTLWFVRNGEIVRVGNLSQGWARAIIDLAVPRDADVDAVQEAVLAIAESFSVEPKWKSQLLEKPELWGIQSVSPDAMVLRLSVKTRTSTRDAVARELRIRIGRDLPAQGFDLPSLQSVVLSGYEGSGFVRGAKAPRTRPLPHIPPRKGKK